MMQVSTLLWDGAFPWMDFGVFTEENIMVVQHNLYAANTSRMMGLVETAQIKSTEKLSSGYRINRAADDAAGFCISEKMRKQIRGLDRATTNASDGISAVQTAEGALDEVQNMLQRMNELAVQSANGTNSISDRSAIQNEIDQLTTEIDRISETTKFNETYLLKGANDVTKRASWSYSNYTTTTRAKVTFTSDATTGLTAAITFSSSTAVSQSDTNYIVRSLRDSGLSITQSHTYDASKDGENISYNLKLTGDAAQRFKVVSVTLYNSAGNGVFEIQDSGGNMIAKITVSGGNAQTATSTRQSTNATAVVTASEVRAQRTQGQIATLFDKDGNAISENALDRYFSLADGNVASADGSTGGVSPRATSPLVYDAVGNLTSLNPAAVNGRRDIKGDMHLDIHVGADGTKNNKVRINIRCMSAKALGVNGMKVDGADSTNADLAIETIKEALQKVSDQRAELGAEQYRLERSIANLENVVENTTASESRIRDTDMAKETVRWSTNNILAQSGQAMLAQANHSNDGVMSLIA